MRFTQAMTELAAKPVNEDDWTAHVEVKVPWVNGTKNAIVRVNMPDHVMFAERIYFGVLWEDEDEGPNDQMPPWTAEFARSVEIAIASDQWELTP